jgi:hypothetical protein
MIIYTTRSQREFFGRPIDGPHTTTEKLAADCLMLEAENERLLHLAAWNEARLAEAIKHCPTQCWRADFFRRFPSEPPPDWQPTEVSHERARA